MIRRKTAKLFEAAARLGRRPRAAHPEVEARLADYGAHVGTAFQLIDDVLDYSGEESTIGKSLGDDLAEGKPTLPLIHAMRAGSARASGLVRNAIWSGGREDFSSVLAAIRASGVARLRARAPRSAKPTRRGRRIAGLPESEFKRSLLELASFSVARAIVTATR